MGFPSVAYAAHSVYMASHFVRQCNRFLSRPYPRVISLISVQAV